jgi:hypothetical protein
MTAIDVLAVGNPKGHPSQVLFLKSLAQKPLPKLRRKHCLQLSVSMLPLATLIELTILQVFKADGHCSGRHPNLVL